MKKQDEEVPIDIQSGIDQVGESAMFVNMMENFENMTLSKNLMGLKMAIDSEDWVGVRDEAHSLKGASSYLCTYNLTNLAKEIQLATEKKDYSTVMKLYPKLIEESIKIKLFIKKYLCELHSTYYQKKNSFIKKKILKFPFQINLLSKD